MVAGLLFSTSIAGDIYAGDILAAYFFFRLPPDPCGIQHNYK